MKFTEEQYKGIIKAWRSKITYATSTAAVIDYLVGDLNVDVTVRGEEALAIANPLTREWAHERYVEKEKRYFWSTKKKGKKGKPMNLLKSAGGIAQVMGPKHALTESEIKEWGYNPDMFNKEEVE